ncbi:anti-sigma factor domain-containing protein [Streptomyces roseus]|uniref:anti-sigma factor n=1 Tax=Streptomyces roseus TaxID=66430 RepID=UPI0036D1EA7B
MNRHASDVHGLAAPYALDALDPGERVEFAAHLAACAACGQDVADFRATAARLAAAAAQAPPVPMKQRTLAAIDHVRQHQPRVAAAAPVSWRGALRRNVLSMALAASLAAAASSAGLAAWEHHEKQQLEQRARQSEQRLDAVSGVLAAPDARTVHGRAGNGAMASAVVSDLRKTAVFTASGLPAPPPGRTYQLWLGHDGTMRPAGFIHRDGAVLLDGDTAGAAAVGLTLEPAGGSPQPTTAPLLLMALPA